MTQEFKPLRETLGWSPDQAAKELQVTRRTIARWDKMGTPAGPASLYMRLRVILKGVVDWAKAEGVDS